ncbi:MAG: hypothetical protein QOH43_784, partial [Solirubrobacteraceae bacterium]|nr:hypothetical protein [Solirubrobacteraceae bacterium]
MMGRITSKEGTAVPHPENPIARLTRRAAPAAAALLAVAGVAAARPAGAEAANLDAPRVMCSTYNPAGHALSARFGVVNHDPVITNIPVGDFNYFDPDPLDRGQPGQFAPGYTFFDANLNVTPADPQLAWVIWGKANVVDMDPAKLPFERPCADTGPTITAVLPGAVHPGGGSQALTIYGQGLAGATVSVGGAGVS